MKPASIPDAVRSNAAEEARREVNVLPELDGSFRLAPSDPSLASESPMPAGARLPAQRAAKLHAMLACAAPVLKPAELKHRLDRGAGGEFHAHAQ